MNGQGGGQPSGAAALFGVSWDPNVSHSANHDVNGGGLPAQNHSSSSSPWKYGPWTSSSSSSHANQQGSQVSHSIPPGQAPSTAFGSFNMPLWKLVNNQPNLPAIPPAMPHLNPSLFPPMMGNTPSPFSMLPMNPMFPFPPIHHMSTMAGVSAPPLNAQDTRTRRMKSRSPDPLVIPSPTEAYMQQALQTPQPCTFPRPLLVILDLNGTLIYRKQRKFPPKFARRTHLDWFLDVLTNKYAVMIWSSSKPETVNAVCQELFPAERQKSVVALWGRDKFGLSHAQYNNKIQVYKELHKVWANTNIQATYPGNEHLKTSPAKGSGGKFRAHNKKRQQTNSLSPGQRWDQTNTILIDDSKLKALSEPFNILEIPEFTNDPAIDESTLFVNILHRLDVLAHHDDVSKLLRVWTDRVDQGEGSILDLDIEVNEEKLDDEDGGINLPQNTINSPQDQNIIDLTLDQPATSQQTSQMPDDPAERRAVRNQRRKLRKKERKTAQLMGNVTTPPKTQQEAASEIDATNDGERNPDKRIQNQKRNQKKNKKAKAKAENAHPPLVRQYNFRARPLNPPASDAEGDVEGGLVDSGVSISAAATTLAPEPAPAQVQAQSSPGLIGTTTDASADADIDTTYETDSRPQPRRSPSPASSAGSENALLDRLEEGLGFRR
ncbi:hypothetical protein NUU61_007205 [Penicillium alfredii]|uniref:FCP1 homology domain-containing protein n=1 Tax=Penicillium alfredii TaxID=1506179 RepID=A0A9W9F2M4_9EURO|nr:uncharacterized protein NUU61_007205 [Penicillium alfredii]KAJ5092335.1 hypothetical protein NUU61_007205 [Penicillium alfredii]